MDGEEIALDKAESLLKDISSKKMNTREFKEKYNDIVKDVEKILNKQPFTRNEQTMIEILLLLREVIKPNDKKADEQPDTTDTPELESEESAAERGNQQGEGVKILTPNQMLSRLPTSLAQLKAGNNSEKLKSEISQLFYSLYRSKNMTKQVYNNLMKPLWIKNIIIAHKIFIMIMIVITISSSLLLLLLLLSSSLLLLKVHIIKWRQFLWILKIIKRMNHTDSD